LSSDQPPAKAAILHTPLAVSSLRLASPCCTGTHTDSNTSIHNPCAACSCVLPPARKRGRANLRAAGRRNSSGGLADEEVRGKKAGHATCHGQPKPFLRDIEHIDLLPIPELRTRNPPSVPAVTSQPFSVWRPWLGVRRHRPVLLK
jgi:hypothetical protein